MLKIDENLCEIYWPNPWPLLCSGHFYLGFLFGDVKNFVKKWANGQKKWANGHFCGKKWPVKMGDFGLKMRFFGCFWAIFGCFWAFLRHFWSYWPNGHFFFIFNRKINILYNNKKNFWPNDHRANFGEKLNNANLTSSIIGN